MDARKDKQEETILLALVKREHARRTEPMEKLQVEVGQLSAQVEPDKLERKELFVLRTELSHLNTTFQDLKWKQELLLQSLQFARKERDECKSKFLANVYKSQRQNERHNLCLENTFRSLIERGERQTATLSNVLMRGNFDSESVKNIQAQITNVLQLKADQISKLDGMLGKAKEIKEYLENILKTHLRA